MQIPNPDDLQGNVSFSDLPFYQWLKSQETPPDRFIEALREYFGIEDLRGTLTDEQVTSYKHIHQHFWWVKRHAPAWWQAYETFSL